MDASDGMPYELGMKFELTRSGRIVGIRYWKCSGDTYAHVGRIWSSNGVALASVCFEEESDSGWQEQALPSPLRVLPATIYVVTVNTGNEYPFSGDGLRVPIVSGDIRSIADGLNGVLGNPGSFPLHSIQNCNYFRDIVFVADALSIPTRLAILPANAITQTGRRVSFTATLQDSGGNAVIGDCVTEFSVTGVPGSFAGPSSVGMVNGRATVSFIPTGIGTAAVTAAASGLVSGTATLHVTADPPRPE
jgi:hypothetical protein